MLVISARKFHPYFHVYDITILTNQPLKHFLQKYGASSRLIKWAVELNEFRINFAHHICIEGQALVDVIAESIGHVAQEVSY